MKPAKVLSKLYSMYGQRIDVCYDRLIQNTSMAINLDISRYISGIYFIRPSGDINTIKLFIKHKHMYTIAACGMIKFTV